MTALIALDWGTTSLRAYRLDRDGAVLEQRESARGILSVTDDRFEDALEEAAGDWLGDTPDAAVLAAGMIGSRQGWHEIPYVDCPADLAAIAAGVRCHRTRSARPIHFVPGLSRYGEDAVPDVMRGEETQVLGALGATGDALLVLPGTHCKWVRTRDGAIDWFATFMTGELFAALVEHTILGRTMEGSGADEAAFARGVAYGAASTSSRGGLLGRLFSARTLALFDEIPAAGLNDYLSGLLIGAEIREATQAAGRGPGGEPVILIGASALVERYRYALSAAGIEAHAAPAHGAARGLHRIAVACGLIPPP